MRRGITSFGVQPYRKEVASVNPCRETTSVLAGISQFVEAAGSQQPRIGFQHLQGNLSFLAEVGGEWIGQPVNGWRMGRIPRTFSP